MPKASVILLFFVLAAIVVGIVFLSTWTIPAPSAEMEIILLDERFEH